MTHADDVTWMERAIELSRKCPPAEGAFSVGAIIVGADGEELAQGYSRETDAHVHAEESALAKLPADDPRLVGATLYSTLEPCSERKSRPLSCTQLILRSPIRRVVIAWREPSLLVADCVGVETLRAAAAEVTELPHLAQAARSVNAHLLP
ncbi:deaminase [Streptomyces sp. NPDC056485]|uniref:deaminase n=1 Tax=Streptomyces sp. NPDC056485 TaxID=3345834 RepID=UPI00369ADC8D